MTNALKASQDDLGVEQERLEKRMARLGIDKFRDAYERWTTAGRAADARPIKTTMEAAITPLVGAIEAFKRAALSGKAGRRHQAVRLLADMDAPVLAFLTVKVVMDYMMKNQELTFLAIKLSNYIELEQNMRRIEELYPEKQALFAYQAEKHRQANSLPNHVRITTLHSLKYEIEDFDKIYHDWTIQEKLCVGLKLIELMCQSTGLFEIKPSRRGRKVFNIITPSALFENWLDSLKTQYEILFPEYLPCVIPPQDWTGLQGGGYHTQAFAYPLNLVKTRSKQHKKMLEEADLSCVFKAVNAIQRSPWAINARVLDVAYYLMDLGTGLAGLPCRLLEVPPKPHDIASNEEARKAWSREAGRIRRFNISSKMQRLQAWKIITMAQEFKKYEQIYFPYQLDFRGRIYSVVSHLSPQGCDLAKGLLHFGKGDAITNKKAKDWLAIHGANCWGLDKVSFSQRLKWVEDHQQRIIDTGFSPLDDLWWTKADSPFCFLAFCFEWLGLHEAEAQGEVFISRLPIAMDGSCNGLQHYSAMLRDPIGGRAVNLVPSDTPQDIYGVVADKVNEKLAKAAKIQDEENPHHMEWAQKWLEFGIDRKITKRPVMVLPYGGTFHSCMDYVQEAVMERESLPFEQKERRKACNYLAVLVWQSIGEVVQSARLAMGWLRKAACGQKGFVSWVTPIGFPVVQYYSEINSIKVNTTLFGKRYQPRIEIPRQNTPALKRQMNGVAPNFVHSLDASALMLTVIEAQDAGLTQFAMIHDSYGTTAAKAEILAKILRHAFVNLYQNNDVLAQFEVEDTPPFVGGLDLTQVLESAYFFA